MKKILVITALSLLCVSLFFNFYQVNRTSVLMDNNAFLTKEVQDYRRAARCYVYSCEQLLDSISVWNPDLWDEVVESNSYWDYHESCTLVDRPVTRPLELDSLVQ